MRQFFKHIFTGKDNQTSDGIKILALTALLLFLIFTVYDAIQTHKFDPQAFSTSFSTLMGTVCLALRVKASTEPE